MTLGWMICRDPEVVNQSAQSDVPDEQGRYSQASGIWAVYIGTARAARDPRAGNPAFFGEGAQGDSEGPFELGRGVTSAASALLEAMRAGRVASRWRSSLTPVPPSDLASAQEIGFCRDAGYALLGKDLRPLPALDCAAGDVADIWKPRRGRPPNGQASERRHEAAMACQKLIMGPPPKQSKTTLARKIGVDTGLRPREILNIMNNAIEFAHSRPHLLHIFPHIEEWKAKNDSGRPKGTKEKGPRREKVTHAKLGGMKA